MIGAAIAAVATESLAGLLLLRYAHIEGLSFVSLRRLWRPVVASCAMVAFLISVPGLNIFLNVADGGFVFAFTFILIGGIRFKKRPSGNIKYLALFNMYSSWVN